MTYSLYPTAAFELLTRFPGGDNFFLLAQVDDDRANNEKRMTIYPDSPILVNDAALRDAIQEQTGIKLATREEFAKKQVPDEVKAQNSVVDWDRLYTVATGPALWLKAGDETRTYLIQNTADKPINPNRWNFASGLVSSRDILDTMFAEMNEETGIFIPMNGILVGLNFQPPSSFPAAKGDFRAAVLGNRNQQIQYIQAQLAKHNPEHAGKPVAWLTVPTEMADQHICEPVALNVLGKRFTTFAHCVVDDNVRSANIHFPLVVDLSGLVSDFNRLVTVDPETLGRNVALVTQEEAAALDTIPAPKDYFERRQQALKTQAGHLRAV